jgi:hypothetical protein
MIHQWLLNSSQNLSDTSPYILPRFHTRYSFPSLLHLGGMYTLRQKKITETHINVQKILWGPCVSWNIAVALQVQLMSITMHKMCKLELFSYECLYSV